MTVTLPGWLSFPASDGSPILIGVITGGQTLSVVEGGQTFLSAVLGPICGPTGMSAPPLLSPTNMTDSNSPSHWDALVLDLGATPPTQEPTPQPVSPPPSQPITPPKSARPAQRSKQPSSGPAQTGNWDLIANELGVTPLPGPAAPAVEAKAAAPAAPAGTERNRRSPPPQRAPQRSPERSPRKAPERTPERVPERVEEKTPERAEDSPNFFDEPFDFEEPFDLLEASETPAADAPPKETESEEPEDRGEHRDRKRRRRRRPGRDSDRRDSRGPASAEAVEGPRRPACTAREGVGSRCRERGCRRDRGRRGPRGNVRGRRAPSETPPFAPRQETAARR